MVLKSSAGPVALAVLTLVTGTATPAAALDPIAGLAFVKVCLPYAYRSASFERAIRRAYELDFRRPVGDTAPLDEWASEVEMVSEDGRWRLRLEEGSGETETGAGFYSVTCSLSSNQASARELTGLADYGFGDDPRWRRAADGSPRWDRVTVNPEEASIYIRVRERDGLRPILSATGEYR